MGEREKSLEKISHVKAREEIAKEKAPRAGVPALQCKKKEVRNGTHMGSCVLLLQNHWRLYWQLCQWRNVSVVRHVMPNILISKFILIIKMWQPFLIQKSRLDADELRDMDHCSWTPFRSVPTYIITCFLLLFPVNFSS